MKRQQAVAIFQARRYMVENALAIIDEVIQHFDAKEGMTMSDDKKAELINSLLIVMTSDKELSPVINLASERRTLSPSLVPGPARYGQHDGERGCDPMAISVSGKAHKRPE